MSTGTAPQRLVKFIENTWTESRTGRGDVPPIIKRVTGNENPDLNRGVVVFTNRAEVGVDLGLHDLVHIYHPSAASPTITDRGFKEVNEVETVQIDISLTDRTDHTVAADTRLSAKERMVGDRDDLAATDEPPYPGILGEMRYLLETIRRGLDEWDTVSHTLGDFTLGNSNADAALTVELERIARNTVQ